MKTKKIQNPIIFSPIKSLLIIYFSLFLFTGCHTFYKVEQNELKEINKNDVVKITFKNGKTVEMINIQKLKFIENNEIEIIRYADNINKIDSTRIVFSLDDIKDIKVEKIDIQKSIFTSFWITIGAIFTILIYFKVAGYDDFSVG